MASRSLTTDSNFIFILKFFPAIALKQMY
uniref:Uncharacterized protein n=1 Tax=Arundo donax TaxID=35708 RepID=A0A0A9CCS2_ARUDO